MKFGWYPEGILFGHYFFRIRSQGVATLWDKCRSVSYEWPGLYGWMDGYLRMGWSIEQLIVLKIIWNSQNSCPHTETDPYVKKRKVEKFWEKFCLPIKFDIDNCGRQRVGVRWEPRGALVSMSQNVIGNIFSPANVTKDKFYPLYDIFGCHYQQWQMFCDIDTRKYIENYKISFLWYWHQKIYWG